MRAEPPCNGGTSDIAYGITRHRCFLCSVLILHTHGLCHAGEHLDTIQCILEVVLDFIYRFSTTLTQYRHQTADKVCTTEDTVVRLVHEVGTHDLLSALRHPEFEELRQLGIDRDGLQVLDDDLSALSTEVDRLQHGGVVPHL